MAEAVLPLMLFTLPFTLLEEALGLLGHETNSSQREWLARWRALSPSGGWIVAADHPVLAVRAVGVSRAGRVCPDLVHSVERVAADHAARVLSARNTRTRETQESSGSRGSWVLEAVAAVAPPLFVVGLLTLLSTFVAWSLKAAQSTGSNDLSQHLLHLGLLFGASLLLALVFGTRVDINDFSMHAFYREPHRTLLCRGQQPEAQPQPVYRHGALRPHAGGACAAFRADTVRWTPHATGWVPTRGRSPSSAPR